MALRTVVTQPDGNLYDSNKPVVSLPNGTFICGYSQSDVPYYAITSDGGISWDSHEIAAHPWVVPMLINNGNTAHLIYENTDANNILWQQYSNGSFSSATPILSIPVDLNPGLAVAHTNRNNVIYVTYSEAGRSTYASNKIVKYDGSWGTPSAIDDSAGLWDAIMDNQNNLHCIFISDDYTTLFYSRFNGSIWSERVTIASSQGGVAIAIDPTDGLPVIFAQQVVDSALLVVTIKGTTNPLQWTAPKTILDMGSVLPTVISVGSDGKNLYMGTYYRTDDITDISVVYTSKDKWKNPLQTLNVQGRWYDGTMLAELTPPNTFTYLVYVTDGSDNYTQAQLQFYTTGNPRYTSGITVNGVADENLPYGISPGDGASTTTYQLVMGFNTLERN